MPHVRALTRLASGARIVRFCRLSPRGVRPASASEDTDPPFGLAPLPRTRILRSPCLRFRGHGSSVRHASASEDTDPPPGARRSNRCGHGACSDKRARADRCRGNGAAAVGEPVGQRADKRTATRSASAVVSPSVPGRLATPDLQNLSSEPFRADRVVPCMPHLHALARLASAAPIDRPCR